jgi:multidrug efflux pump subunit AcrB
MRIRTPMGAEVPFSAVATAEVTRGYATIRRSDRKRIVDVTADVDSTVGQASAIIADLEANVLPGILQSHPGVRYKLEGQSNEQAETVAAMSRYFIMALLIIYGLMAIPFRSYMQPLIVMSAIPFGFVGAVLGHLFMGLDLSMLSVMGMAALAGVVVNDSLVLVDFVNRRREDGLSVIEAARTAGVQRFRPVMLTSITTFAGLTPLILEKSVQAQFLIPMAVSLAFGVMFATLVTLMLVPSGYLILDDLAKLPARLFGTAPAAEPDAGHPV